MSDTVDLDKWEKLARASIDGTHFDDDAFWDALSPAVVLQWVAETRTLREERDLANSQWEKWASKHHLVEDALRVAVEALEFQMKQCAAIVYGELNDATIFAMIRANHTHARTALDEIKKLSGGQGEGKR